MSILIIILLFVSVTYVVIWIEITFTIALVISRLIVGQNYAALIMWQHSTLKCLRRIYVCVPVIDFLQIIPETGQWLSEALCSWLEFLWDHRRWIFRAQADPRTLLRMCAQQFLGAVLLFFKYTDNWKCNANNKVSLQNKIISLNVPG